MTYFDDSSDYPLVYYAQKHFARVGNYVLVEPPRHHARSFKTAQWHHNKLGWYVRISETPEGRYRLTVVKPGLKPKVVHSYPTLESAIGAMRFWDQARKNPRKISEEAADALMKGYKYKNSNTEVKEGADWQSSRTGLYTLVLHGTEIAWHDLDAGDLLVHDGDYPGTVTKERLNALPNVQVHHSKKQLYLNGKMWNGDTVLVVKDSVPTFPYRKV